ncbi:MAG TPA: hypothetical protein VMC42_06685 [Methanoregulaceae archaeon]|nr:hypothetical protein [Methanoregulaceae archaeon]
MGLLDNLGGGMSNMLQTPEGQEMVKKFLGSPEGQNMIVEYVSSPEGRKLLGTMLLGVVDRLNLSPEQKQTIRTIAEQQLSGSAPAPATPQ